MPGQPLPDPGLGRHRADGLIAVGRDLSAQRLLEAYPKGLFPWFSEGQPVLWWSPDPRMVLRLNEFRIRRSLAKTLRRLREEARWELRLNTAFEQVMRECAAPRQQGGGTWITRDIIAAYTGLHRMGLAHSVECWCEGELIGGLYGVSIGRMFFGESMFAKVTDASKVALAGLVQGLQRLDFPMIDCQQNTGHLASLGAREMPRALFLEEIKALSKQTPPDWTTLRIALPDA